ncbi:MAG: uncharacterized protein KVP18_003915 [Porospora cf. gigantea A]|uniref:uncharacterized protein n=1 Tax=Porospora cf. gigantea A TaxID=2853593 RepID=UPI003559FC67|nr:MAG: hypothetical protein KVP18_003915 [Porospora cf. gigantea A]
MTSWCARAMICVDRFAAAHFEAVAMIKLLTNVFAECISSTPWRHPPPNPFVWIGPKQVAHWAFMWHLNVTVDLPHLV